MSSAIVDVTEVGGRFDVVIRVAIGLLAAAVITFLLYWMMSAFLAAGRDAITDAPAGRVVEFVSVPTPPELKTVQPKPEKPPKPQLAPEVKQLQANIDNPSVASVNIGNIGVGNVQVTTDASISASDGNFLPIVKVAPRYPERARSNGIEGYVLLEFTITKTGAVADPSVVYAEPQGVFNEAALDAVKRFKYKPRVVNGKPQPVQGVRHIIRFRLTN